MAADGRPHRKVRRNGADGLRPPADRRTTHVHATAINNAAPGATLRVTGPCTGNFTINKNLTLIGVGNAVLDGNQTDTTVRITSGVQAQLTALTISNGNGLNGGGIANNGGTVTVTRGTVSHNVLTVNGSTVTGNSAPSVGGIYNYAGTLTMSRTTVSNNSTGSSGAVFNYYGGTATLDHSTVSNNTSTAEAGGIENLGALTLDTSTVRDNTAATTGGGIVNDGGGSTTLNGSTVTRNTVNGGPGSGGGIFNGAGTVQLNGSRVRNNQPDNCAPENTIPGCTN